MRRGGLLAASCGQAWIPDTSGHAGDGEGVGHLVAQGTSGTGRVRRIGTSVELSQQEPRARRGRSSCRDALRLRRAAVLRCRSSGSRSGTVAVGASDRGPGWVDSAGNPEVAEKMTAALVAGGG